MNMRKIIAILTSVLLLCAAIPMGALSVSAADPVLSLDFEDGDAKLTNAVICDTQVGNGTKSIQLDCSSTNYAQVYTYLNLQANTDYVVNFKAYSTKTAGLSVYLLNGSWASITKASVNIHNNNWAEYTVTVNPGDNTTVVFGLQSGWAATEGLVYYFDDITVIEKSSYKPSYDGGDAVLDKDFEDGNAAFSNAAISNEAANGSNGIALDCGAASYAQVYTYLNVTANTDYIVSFKAKSSSNNVGISVNFLNGSWAGIMTKKVSLSKEWVEYTVVMNPGDNTSVVFGLQCGWSATEGLMCYFDDVIVSAVLEEPEEPEEPVVDGNLVLDWNFDDDNAHFTRGVVEDGYMVFDATTANWQNCYSYINSIVAEKDYVVTFKAKADKKASMNLKVNDNWGADAFVSTVNVTTAWQYFTVDMNCSPFSSPILMFSSNAEAANAAIYYIDDVKIYEKPVVLEPGVITNGDFETGDLSGWEKHQSTAISTDAHSGSYAANIKGNGGWGGMLNQNVAVEAGKTYKISLWVKAIANGANIQVKDGGTDGANLANTWFTKNEWNNVVWEVTPTTDIICFNFCGGGNGIAEDVLVDDITIAEVKVASFDGYLYNGDFETGEANHWTMYSGTAVSADAAYTGNYGVHIKNPNGGWDGTAYQDFTVVVGKTYNVTMWAKNLDGARGQNIQIQNPIGTTVASDWFDNKTEWTLLSFEFTATSTDVRINICGGGTGSNEEIYVDDIKVTEVSAPVVESIWHADFNDGNKKFNVGEIVAEGPDGSNCYKWDFGGQWSANYVSGVNMDFTQDYSIVMKVKGSVNGSMGITLQTGSWGAHWNGPSFNVTTEWKEVILHVPANTVTIPSGSTLFKLQGVGGDAYTLYVDDIAIVKGLVEIPEEPSNPDASFDGYIYNGDFETGSVDSAPSVGVITGAWYNLYGNDTINFVEGYESTYAMQMIAGGQWRQVRQDKIPVEPNTTYRLSAYVKNAQNMSFVIKKGNDAFNLTKSEVGAFPNSNDWQLFTMEFNTGVNEDGNAIDPIDSICILVISTEKTDASVIIDNITLEKVEEPAHVHEYDDDCDEYCNSCDEWRQAPHELDEHFEAKVPANCSETGWSEYWSCGNCGAIFGDAEASSQLNPAWILYTGEHVRPEGSLPCTVVACEICGEDDYGEACTRPEDAPVCQDVDCVYCGETIFGWGCNYNTGDEEIPVPLCGEGDCVYCGTHYEKLYEHENGSWASCIEDGECAYGCGLIFPATGIHELDDPCAGGTCWMCWQEIEGAHTYVYPCDQYCNECGEKTNASAKHSIVYVAAKEATSCVEFGNKEYWTCEHCGGAWLDEGLMRQTNLKSVMIAGECVSDSPACKDGVCVNCGLPCGAEADHVYDDDYDATCNECGDIRDVPEKPVDVIYGDADGDGEITALDATLLDQYVAGWEVTLNEASADADGDGEITALDATLLDQYVAGWEVTLGPVA